VKASLCSLVRFIGSGTVGFLVCIQPAAQAQPPVVPPDVVANIHFRVTNALTPGIVVGMVNSSGTTFSSYGVGDLDTGDLLNEDSVFEIGSITKTFTCTMLSQLILEGSMVLTNPVKEYLPANVRVPSRNGKEITLRHLVTHRSGLPRMPTNWNPADMLNPYGDYTVQQMDQFLSSYQLPRDPDASFEYSNFGMGLVGYVLTLRTGSDYEALVSERVTRPLGMGDTGISLTSRMVSHLARGYSGVVQVPNWDFTPVFVGAGAIRSTARDLLQYIAANMGLMQTSLYPAMTNAQAVLADAFPGISIGMAWFTTPIQGDQIVWHDGGTGGYRSYAGFLRNKKLGVVVLANSDYEVDDLGAHLLDPTQALLSVPQPVVVDSNTLRRCVGRFRGSDGNYFDIGLAHGHLVAAYSTDRGVSFTLFSSTSLSYFATVVDGTAQFQADSQGLVNKLVWTQSGQSLTYNRVPLPARLAIERRDAQIQISFTGDTGVNYVLEAGADLTHWLPIATNTIWAAPVMDVQTDSCRFYRLRRP
jgi:serine-type D-Ala-D-Ala carboxypeptidase/endopeptidase